MDWNLPADRPAVQRGERAAGEEHVQRHRQPGHRLRLHRRARRHPRRDALPEMTRFSFRPESPSGFSHSRKKKKTQASVSLLPCCVFLIGLCNFDPIVGVLLLHLGVSCEMWVIHVFALLIFRRL